MKKVVSVLLLSAIFYATLAITSMAFASDIQKVDITGNQPVRVLKQLIMPPDRTVAIEDEINAYSVSKLMSQMLTLSDSHKDIYIYINSPGGSVEAGVQFIDFMHSLRDIRDVKTTCVIGPLAASMAAIISSYCGKTYISQHGRLMFHQAAYSVSGSQEEIEKQVAHAKEYLNRIQRELAAQMGVTFDWYKSKITTEWWLTSEEACRFGLVDGLVKNLIYVPLEPQANRNVNTKTVIRTS